VTYVAVPLQIYALTKSSLWVGLLGSAQLVPLVVAALFGGALADRLDRRRLLIWSEAILACGSLALLLNAGSAHPSVVVVFVVSALMSGVNGFHRPALEAMTPRLVGADELSAVAALGTLRHSAAAIGGPALGGWVIATFGLSAAYAFDVVSFVLSIGCIAALVAPPAPPRVAASPLRSIVDGLRYGASRPELVGTYVVDIVAMTFAMPVALFPQLGDRWGGAEAAGWLFAAIPIGSLMMTLVSGFSGRIHRHGAAVVIAAAIWGLAIVALGFAGSLLVAVTCLAIAGAADMVSGMFRQTIWNQTVPNEMRGRLAGVEMISYMTGPLLGNARAGAVASAFGVSFSIGSGGVVCVAGVLLCVPLLPAFWRYQRSSPSRREPSVAASDALAVEALSRDGSERDLRDADAVAVQAQQS
ncbi:MAG: MFS transporter, partial [Polyangiaceae bacterium]